MASGRWINWFSGKDSSQQGRKKQPTKAMRRTRDRKVFFESLEDRRVLAIDFSTINTVANPNAVDSGDFNGDGFTDFAMANSATNNITVQLRNAAGVVQSSFDYSVGTTPVWLTAGDFNNDGNRDLAVANLGSNNLSLLSGNGDGSFQAAVNVNVGVAPTSVVTGDFNADGQLDLVSTNFGSNDMSVLGGNGDGTFQAAVNLPAGWRPLSASVVSYSGLFGDTSFYLSVNNLNTTVATDFTNQTPAGTNAFDFSPFGGFSRPSEENITAGDFNGDGYNDIATADAATNSVIVDLQGQLGNLLSRTSYSVGSVPTSITSADLNGDGIRDLAVSNLGSNSVSVLRGNGDGSFQVAVNVPTGLAPISVAIADFDNDGDLDLATANFGGNDATILRNTNGSFQSAGSFSAGWRPVAVSTNDSNNDGLSDLLVSFGNLSYGTLQNNSTNDPPPPGAVTIDADPTQSDNLTLSIVAGVITLAGNNPFATTPAGWTSSNGGQTLSFVGSVFPASVTINGGGGDDTLQVNLTDGVAIPEIKFDGGAGSDAMAIIGSGTETVTYQPADSVGTNGKQGNVIVDGAVIHFDGLEPIDIANVASFTLDTSGIADTLTIANGTNLTTGIIPTIGTQAAILITGTTGQNGTQGVGIEDVALWNIPSVTVNTAVTGPQDGNDTITITGADGVAATIGGLTITTGVGTDVVNVTGGVTVANVSLTASTITLGGTVNAATALSLVGTTVTQTVAMNTPALTLGASGNGGTYTLDNVGNTISTLAATTTASASVTDSAAGLILNGGNVGGAFVLTTTGGLSQSATVTAGSLSAANSGTGTINLTTNNLIGTFAANNSASGGLVQVQFANANPVIGAVGAVTGIITNGGDVSAKNPSGDLTISNPISTAGGFLTLTSSVGNINLGSNLSTVGVNAGGINFTGTTVITNNVTMITDAPGTDGSVTFVNAVQSDGATNERQLSITAGSGNVSTIGIGTSTRLGTIAVVSAGSLSVGSLNAGAGGINLNATAGISLNGANVQNANAGLISITGPVTLGTNVTVQTSTTGNITFGTNSTINSDATPRSLTLTTSTGSIALNNTVIGGTAALTTLAMTGANVNSSGNITTTGGVTVTNTGSASTLSGVIAGTGATLTKAGAGTLILTGSNTLTGGINIAAGTLQVSDANPNALGPAANTITFTGNGTLYNSNNTVNVAQGIAVNSGVTAILRGAFGEVLNVAGAVTGSGTLRLQGDSNGWAVNFNSTANTFTGPIQIQNNAGTSTLTVNSLADAAANIELGNTTNVGIFVYGAGAIAPLVLSQRQIVLAGTTGGGSFTNNAPTANTVTINTDVLITGVGAKTLTLGGSNTGANTFAGKIIDGTGSAVSLTKSGAGLWTLSNANTYTGGTTISGGTLAVTNSSALGTGALTMNGGTLNTSVNLANSITLNATTNTIAPNGNYRLLSGPISGAGGFIVANGGGTPGLEINNTTNSFGGNITINANTFLRLTNSEVIPNTASIQNDGNLRLDVTGGGTETIAGLSGSSTGSVWVPVTNSTLHTLVVGSGNATSSYAGTLGASGQNNAFLALTKTGTGTLSLSGANVYSAGSTLNAGTLSADSDAALGTGTVTLAGATLRSISGNRTLANNLVASASTSSSLLDNIGTGDLILTGTVTGTGALTVNSTQSRSIWFQGNGSGFAGTINYTNNNGGTNFRFGGTGTTQNTLTNGSDWSGTTFVLSGAPTNDRGISWNGLAGTAIKLGSLAGTGRIGSGNTAVWEIGALGTNTTYTGLIEGASVGLLKVGAGTLTLSGANTYTGGTTISRGAIVAANSNALSTSGTVTINNAATGTANTSLLIDSSAGSITIGRAISVANQGTGIVTIGTSASAGGNQSIFSGAITLAKAVTLQGATTGGDRTQFSGGISGTGDVTISAPQRVIFISAANTYVGNTTINSGSFLQLSDGTSTALSFIPDSSAVTVNGTINIAKGNNNETIGSLLGSGTVQGHPSVPNIATTLTVGSGGGSGDFTGVLSNGGASGATLSLTKTGTGTQTLSGVNTYSGTTTVSQGVIAVGSNTALGATGAAGKTTVASGAQVTFPTASLTVGETFTISGDGGGNGALAMTATTVGVTLTGPIDLDAAATIGKTTNQLFDLDPTATIALDGFDLTINAASGSFLTTNGVISGAGNVIKTNTGRWVTDAANTYTGTTSIRNGQVRISSGNDRLPVGTAVTLGDGTGNTAGTLELEGNISQTLAGLLTAGTGVSRVERAASGTPTLNLNIAGTNTFGGILGNTGTAGADGFNVTKSGSGTLVLTNTNTYTGTTTVTAGTLTVNGSIGGSSLISVQTGATLNGTGTTGPLTIAAGGTHNPGNSPGITTVVGNYTENGLLVTEIGTASGSVAGTDYDQVNVTSGGTVTIGGTATLSVPYLGTAGTFNPAPAQVYVIINNDLADAVTGTFSGLPAGTSINVDTPAKTLKIFYNGGDGNDVVLVAANGTPTTLYINDEFTTASSVDGDAETAGYQQAFVGIDAFATITDALTAYPAFAGTIYVNGGVSSDALLAGGGAVTVRLIRDIANGENDVTFTNLSGDASDSIATQFISATGLLTINQGSFGGIISGTGGVTKTTAGTLTLSGANSFTGATNVSAGTLALQNTYASTSHVIASGAVLELNVASGTRDFASTTFSGAGTLRKTGAGEIKWPSSAATFNLATGSLIDVQAGLMVGGNFANENWTNNKSDLNIATGAFFAGVEGNVVVNALTGGGTLSTGFPGAGYTSFTLGVDNGSGNFSGTIINGVTSLGGFADFGGAVATGNLTKVGTGTQILSGDNTYSGTTTVSAGTLQIGNAGTTGTLGTGAVIDNASLVFNRSNGITVANVISGTGSVTQAGSGTLTLSSATNSYSGTTIFAAGITNVASVSDYGANSSLGNRSADSAGNVGLLFRGGTLQYTGSTAQSTNRAIRISTTGGATIDASGSGSGTFSFTATSSPDFFENPGARSLTLTGTNTGSNTFAMKVSQAGGQTTFRKLSSGTWFVTNNTNDYTGETIIGGGILNVSSVSNYGVPSAIGSRASADENNGATGIGLHFTGGTLQYTGATPQSTNRQIRMLNGNGATIDASGSVATATLSFTHSGNNINLFDTGGVRTLTLTGTNTGNNLFGITLNDQATSPTHLVKNQAGTWTYGGSADGTVFSGSSDANNRGTITVNAGLLTMTGKNNARIANVSSQTVVNSGATLQLVANAGNTTAGTSVVLSSEQTAAQPLIINNNGTLSLRSDSDVTFAGGNNFGGLGGATVTIDVNQINTGNTNKTLGFAPGGFATANTTINVTGGNGYTLATGAVTTANNSALTLNANTANLSMTSIASVVGLTVSGASNTLISGAISNGSSASTLQKNGTGTLTLGGANTYSGVTTISAGTLQVGNAGTSGTLGTGAVTNNATLAFNRTDTVTVANNITGTGIINHIGSGTTNLTGANTAAGGTNITAGRLNVNNTLGSNVIVTSPGILGGTGTITGNVSGNGTVAPGLSPGVLTITGAFTPTGTVQLEVNSAWVTAGTDFDRIVVNGTVNLSGATLQFLNTVDASAPATNLLIKVIDNDGTADATTASTNPAEASTLTIGSRTFKIYYNGGDGNDVVLVESGAPPIVYVDDAWAALTNGTIIADADPVAAGAQPAIYGTNAFSGTAAGFTFLEAITAVAASGTVIVNAGNYSTQAVNITKQLTMNAQEGAISFGSLDDTVTNATLNLNGIVLTVGGNNGSTSFDSVIASTGSLTKVGTGTMTLSGANTYSGATTVNDGVLQVGAATTPAIPLTPYVRYTFDAGTVAGTTVTNLGAGVAKNGTLTNGALVNATAGLNGSGALAIADNDDQLRVALGGVDGAAKGVDLAGGVWTASAWFSGLKPVGQWRTLFRGNSADHQVIVQDTTYALGTFVGSFSSATYNVTPITTGWHHVTAVGSGTSTQMYVDGVLVGTSALKSVTDILSIGNHTGNGQPFADFIDNVAIYKAALTPAEVLQLYQATSTGIVTNAIPDVSNVTVAATGTLNLNGANETIGSLAGAGSVALGTGALTAGGTNATTTFSGVISSAATSGGLTKTGTGTLTLSGGNTYAGNTTVAAGTLQLSTAANRLPTGAALTVSTGAFFDLNNQNQQVGQLLGTGRVVDSTNDATLPTLTIANAVEERFDGILGNASQDGFNLNKQGAGRLTLGSANTYSGVTTITNGTLRLGNSAALGVEGSTASKTVISGTGTLDVGGVRVGATGNEFIEVQGTGFGGNGAIINSVGAQTAAFRNITLTGNTTFSSNFRWDMRDTGGASTLNMNGFTITKTGAQEVAFVNTAITNPGSVAVNQNIFRIEGTTDFDGTGTITVANAATLDFWGNNQTHNVNITGAAGANITANGGGTATMAGTLTLNGIVNVNTINNGGVSNLTAAGQITGAGGINKGGTETLNITGATNNYTGANTFNAGTVVVTQNNGLGTVAGSTSVFESASLVLSNVAYSTAEPLILLGSGAVSGTGVNAAQGALRSIGGNNSFAGNISVGNEAANVSGNPGALIVSGTVGNTLTLSGSVTSNYPLSFGGDGNTTVTGAISGIGGNNFRPGLLAGFLNSAFEENAINPAMSVQLGVNAGQSNVGGGNPWADNRTWVYTGQFFDADGFFAFAENIDDNVLIKIDGVTRLRNTTWNGPTTTGSTTDNTFGGTTNFGMGPNGDGWHNVEFRLGNGTGGAGAVAGTGWTATFGFGLNASNNLTQLASPNGSVDGYSAPVDPGNATLFRTRGFNSLTKTGAGTLTLSGNNTFSGETTVENGTLIVNNNNALGTPASGTNSPTTVLAGATLSLPGGVTVPASENFVVDGSGSGGNGVIQNAGNNTLGGNITAIEKSAGSITLGSSSGTLTIGGGINLNYSAINVVGAGNITVNGAVTGVGVNTNRTYAQEVLADNPLGFWQFNEQGDVAFDSSGRNNAAQVFEVNRVAGRTGGGTAMSFDGASDVTQVLKAELGSLLSMTANNQTTISIWMNGDVASQPRTQSTFGGYNATNSTATRVVHAHLPWSDSVVYWDAGNGAPASGRTQTAAQPAGNLEGAWNNWVFVKDGVANNASIYLNGTLVISETGTETTDFANLLSLFIGGGDSGTFFGLIDDFAIYNTALSGARITQVFNANSAAQTQLTANNNLVKTGTGTLTLAGTNTYNGTTAVNDGTLIVTGSIANGAAATDVTVTDTAGGLPTTLSGTGTINGAVQMNSGTLVAPGATPTTGVIGTLSINNDFTFVAGSNYQVDLTPPGTSDKLAITGIITLGNANLQVTTSAPLNNTTQQTFNIIDNNNPTPNTFVNGIFNGLAEGAPVTITGGGNTVPAYITYRADSTGVTIGPDVNLNTQPIIDGTLGNDILVIRQLSGNAAFYEFSLNAAAFVQVAANVPFTFNAGDGNDIMVVDLVNGAVTPTGGIFFNGNNGTDLFSVRGTTTQTATYSPSATTLGQGTVLVTGSTLYNLFTAEEVDLFNLNTATLNLAAATNSLTSANGTGTDASTFIPSTPTTSNPNALRWTGTTGGQAIAMAVWNNNTLNVNGNTGADTFTINNSNNAHANVNVNINTGANAADTIAFGGELVVTGDVTLTTAGNVTDGNGGTNNLTADDVTIVAASGIELDTSINTLQASNSTAGNILVRESNGLTITGTGVTSTSGGNVTVTVTTGNLQQNAAVSATGAGTIAITANGGNITMADLTTTTSSTGSISYSATGNVALSLLTSTSGNINVTADSGAANTGAITEITALEAANLVTTGIVTLSAAAGIGSAGGAADIDTNIGTLVATNDTTGNIFVQETNGLIIAGTGVRTTAGNGNINVDVDAGSLIVNSVVTANGSGTVLLNADVGLVDINAVVSSTSGLILVTGDSITQDANISTGSAATVTVTADNGDITMANGTTTSNGSGVVAYTATGSIALSVINSTSGDVNITADSGAANTGAITDNTAAETANVITTGIATFSAAAGIGSAGGAADIDTTIGTLVATNDTTGNIFIQETSGLVIAGTGVRTTAGNGNINVDVDAGNLDVNSVVTANGSGTITLNADAGTIDLNAVVSSTSGAIVVTGDLITQDANISTGSAATINVTADNGSITMAAATSTTAGSGAIGYSATTNVALALLTTSTGVLVVADSDVNGSGAITDSNAATNNVVATNAIFTAATGIGSGASLEIVVSNLAASNTTSGSIDLDDLQTTGLTIDSVTVFATTLSGVTNNGGQVNITNTGSVTVNAPVNASGNIFLHAIEAGGAGQNMLVAANITSSTGSVTLTAGDNLTINATRTVSGSTGVTMNTDADNAGSVVNIAGTVTTITGDIVLNTANGVDSVTLTGTMSANGSGDIYVNLGAGDDVLDARTATPGTLTAVGDIITINAGNGADIIRLGDVTATAAITAANTVLQGLDSGVAENPDGGDSFFIRALASTPYEVEGDDPTLPVGDTLNVDMMGVVGCATVMHGFPNTTVTFQSGQLPIVYREIETYISTTGCTNDVFDLNNYPIANGDAFDVFLIDTNTIQVQLDGVPVFTGPDDPVNSLTFAGRAGLPDAVRVHGLAGTGEFPTEAGALDGLTTFTPGPVNYPLPRVSPTGIDVTGVDVTAVRKPVSSSFTGTSPARSVPNGTSPPAFYYDGRGGGDSFVVDFPTARDVAYYTDSAYTGAGDVSVQALGGQIGFVATFRNLGTVNLKEQTAAGSSLLIDASSTAGTANLTITNIADPAPADPYSATDPVNLPGANSIVGDGGFTTNRFGNFQTVKVLGGGGAETIDLVSIDSLGLSTVTLDGDNTAGNDASNDTLRIQSLPATATATMLGGAGDDAFIVSTGILPLVTTTAVTDNILGQITVDGEASGTTGNRDTLTISDRDSSSTTAGLNIEVTETAVSRITGRDNTNDVQFSNIETLNVFTSNVADNIVVDMDNTVAGVITATVNSSGGDDQFELTGVLNLNRLDLQGAADNDTFGASPGLPAHKIVPSLQTTIVISGEASTTTPGLTNTSPSSVVNPSPIVPPTDRLNLNVSTVSSAGEVVDTGTGQVLSLGLPATHRPLYFNGIEDIDLYDLNQLTDTIINDMYVKGAEGAVNETFLFSRGFTNTADINLRYNNRLPIMGAFRPSRRIYTQGRDGNDYMEMNFNIYSAPGSNLWAEFRGEGGNDTMSTGAGNDLLIGGLGNDTILAGGGNDVIWGDQESTIANGLSRQGTLADGNDSIQGGDGNDIIFSGGGTDSIQGNNGDDYLHGGLGNDTITGGYGIDLLRGEAGNDTLSGEQDNDIILGGTGDDIVFGRAGVDIMVGGDGLDRLNDDEASDDLLISDITNYDTDNVTSGSAEGTNDDAWRAFMTVLADTLTPLATRRSTMIAGSGVTLAGRQLGVGQVTGDAFIDVATSFAGGAEWIITKSTDTRASTNTADIVDTF